MPALLLSTGPPYQLIPLPVFTGASACKATHEAFTNCRRALHSLVPCFSSTLQNQHALPMPPMRPCRRHGAQSGSAADGCSQLGMPRPPSAAEGFSRLEMPRPPPAAEGSSQLEMPRPPPAAEGHSRLQARTGGVAGGVTVLTPSAFTGTLRLEGVVPFELLFA